MTDDEIQVVAKIMLTADGGCSTCYRKLLDQLKEAFPEQEEAVEAVSSRATEICTAHGAQMSEWLETYEGLEPRIWLTP